MMMQQQEHPVSVLLRANRQKGWKWVKRKLQEYVKKNKEDLIGWYYLSMVSYEYLREDKSLARKAYKYILKKKKTNKQWTPWLFPWTHLRYGLILEGEGKRKQALLEIKKALQYREDGSGFSKWVKMADKRLKQVLKKKKQ